MEKTRIKNKNIFGILLIILGFIGLVVPVIPGWLLLLAGMLLM